MNRYIFDFGSVFAPDDDVTACVEVPAADEQEARVKLVGHLDGRAGNEDPGSVPFVVDEGDIQFRFYINKALSDISVEHIVDEFTDALTPGQA